VPVTLHVEPTAATMSDDLSGQVYLIVQEAVMNAARHAQATAIQVSVASNGDELTIQVSDNGQGFSFVGSYDLATLNALQKGPLTLKERVRELGDSLLINSGRSGAEVRITVPFAQASS
jgi:two-component system sensor histidine kinase UhpB